MRCASVAFYTIRRQFNKRFRLQTYRVYTRAHTHAYTDIDTHSWCAPFNSLEKRRKSFSMPLFRASFYRLPSTQHHTPNRITYNTMDCFFVIAYKLKTTTTTTTTTTTKTARKKIQKKNKKSEKKQNKKKMGALLSSLKSGREPLDIFLDFESKSFKKIFFCFHLPIEIVFWKKKKNPIFFLFFIYCYFHNTNHNNRFQTWRRWKRSLWYVSLIQKCFKSNDFSRKINEFLFVFLIKHFFKKKKNSKKKT